MHVSFHPQFKSYTDNVMHNDQLNTYSRTLITNTIRLEHDFWTSRYTYPHYTWTSPILGEVQKTHTHLAYTLQVHIIFIISKNATVWMRGVAYGHRNSRFDITSTKVVNILYEYQSVRRTNPGWLAHFSDAVRMRNDLRVIR